MLLPLGKKREVQEKTECRFMESLCTLNSKCKERVDEATTRNKEEIFQSGNRLNVSLKIMSN